MKKQKILLIISIIAVALSCFGKAAAQDTLYVNTPDSYCFPFDLDSVNKLSFDANDENAAIIIHKTNGANETLQLSNVSDITFVRLYPNADQSSVLPLEEIVDGNIVIYPNPVDNILTISVLKLSHSTLKNIFVYDISGSLLSQHSCNSTETSMSFANAKPGIYLLQIITDKETITKKIIKK